jgi:hypothetical protein
MHLEHLAFKLWAQCGQRSSVMNMNLGLGEKKTHLPGFLGATSVRRCFIRWRLVAGGHISQRIHAS